MLRVLRSIYFGLLNPKSFLKWIRGYSAFVNGQFWIKSIGSDSIFQSGTERVKIKESELKIFFDKKTKGRGIWKWEHYFDVYDRHLSKFVNKPIHLLEIGIYSGGSLEMWRSYFGNECNIIGVDIEPACKSYANEFTKVIIGDQESRSFWKDFRQTNPYLDIIIDDGGHQSNQQTVTFEESFRHLKPGGVFICEDIHGLFNDFTFHSFCIAMNLNGMKKKKDNPAIISNSVQRQIASMHFYPFMVVIEKAPTLIDTLIAPRHGTEWQPFL
ncbi:MAG: class I SAM-dependent methyltransferase [Saprospiraceae bacterium]